MENKKEIIKTVVIIILIVVMVGLFTVPQYLDKQYTEAYDIGVNDTIITLAAQQTETGNILLVYNDSLEIFPLSTLCGLGQEVQG